MSSALHLPSSGSSCLSCGRNPVSHRATWLTETFAVLSAPLDRFLLDGFVGQALERIGRAASNRFFRLLEALGVVRYGTHPTEKTSARGRVLWEEASRRGIPMRAMQFFGREIDAYEARLGNGRVLRWSGLPRPRTLVSPHALDDKAKLKQRLVRAGIPVPRGATFTRYEPLRRYFATLEKPVIVKPRLGSRGRHTTTFIYKEADLREAFQSAKQLCHWVMAEEHLVGSVYRATVVNGKLAGVLAGDPPRVTGDGVRTIRELISLANEAKPAGVRDVVVTPLTERFLARQSLSLETVLPAGTEVDVSEKIGVGYGGRSAEVTDETHEETKRVLERAAGVLQDPLIGFDFIIKNIAAHPGSQRWGIIECNSVPFVNLHHDPLIGRPRNVAKYVWDLWEPSTG